MQQELPRVNYQDLQSNDASAISSLDHACRDWGFFRLEQHGISAEKEAAFVSGVADFFAMPKTAKETLYRTEDNPWGYYDKELTKNRQDWKEIFDLGIDVAESGYNSRTPWPERLPAFKALMLDWFAECEAISLELLSAISKSLGQPRSKLTPYFSPLNTSFLRLNHYPTCHNPADPLEAYPESGHLGISHHTDAGALTVLWQDQIPGLQVRHQENWITVAPEPGTLIINVGDLVQVWSNDRYQAPLHRVLANSRDERLSAAFFMNPAFSTDCEPLVDMPRYRPVNWGQFRASRAAGDYANLGEEVQISHYRI